MGFTGFEEKCIGRIMACLTSARLSILVNGSPMMEFDFYKGLRVETRQPYITILNLFWLWRGLHVINEETVNTCMLKEVWIRKKGAA